MVKLTLMADAVCNFQLAGGEEGFPLGCRPALIVMVVLIPSMRFVNLMHSVDCYYVLMWSKAHMKQAAEQLGMEILTSEDDLRRLNHPCAAAVSCKFRSTTK